ncbi:hypothetical protein PFISCL1PPCAC_929, partial [Pristionchus fissidentatus]
GCSILLLLLMGVAVLLLHLCIYRPSSSSSRMTRPLRLPSRLLLLQRQLSRRERRGASATVSILLPHHGRRVHAVVQASSSSNRVRLLVHRLLHCKSSIGMHHRSIVLSTPYYHLQPLSYNVLKVASLQSVGEVETVHALLLVSPLVERRRRTLVVHLEVERRVQHDSIILMGGDYPELLGARVLQHAHRRRLLAGERAPRLHGRLVLHHFRLGERNACLSHGCCCCSID